MDEQQTKSPPGPQTEQRGERATYWTQVLQEHTGSGLSVRAFCQERHLAEHSFYWWRRQLRGTTPRARRSRCGERRARAGFVEVVATDRPAAPAWSGITLHVDGRLHVVVERGFDTATLRAVLAAVAGATPCSP